MNRIYFFIAGILFSTVVFAQKTTEKNAVDKGLASISKQGLEAHLSFLADDLLEGREAGKRGGRIASEYIKTVLLESGITPFFDTYFQNFEAYSRERQTNTEFQVHPDSITLYKQDLVYRKLNLRNVLGYIEGQRKNEYVVIGAHYDHLGVDEFLVNDKIYNGADDNASGVALVLQVAKAFVASGEKPLRSVIFAFWDGEEVNYLGSEYFAANFKNINDIKGYINLDMVGREGGFTSVLLKYLKDKNVENKKEKYADNAFSFFYTESLAQSGKLLDNDVAALKLDVAPNSHLLSQDARGSDFLPFGSRGVPILWFFTGMHPDYHTPDDETERINWEKLTSITKLTYLRLWYLAFFTT